MNTWNISDVEERLNKAFEDNSEMQLLDILKNNSFLFYELYTRKYGIQPNFAEISFGDKHRCDFAWLNDNSDGPEWVLVEIEKPKMKLFTKNSEPRAELNHAIEQVKSWIRYFHENPTEKKRIFGAVSRFKFILVSGDKEEWESEHAVKWRAYHNSENLIEIRSSNVFKRAIRIAKEKPEELWSFVENPKSLKHTDLEEYWMTYGYMDSWRKMLK
jgi:hypothetical protein